MKTLSFKTVLTFLMIFLFSMSTFANTTSTEDRGKGKKYGHSKHRKRGTGKHRACNGKRIFNPKKIGF